MDEDEVSLPALPLQEPATRRSRVPMGCVSSRKRPFNAVVTQPSVDEEDLAAAFNTSSDPAFFSSEETPDLENYSGKKRRKKKVFSGTWWARLRKRQDTESSTEQDHVVEKKRSFRRNVDSGVFMADEWASSSDLNSDPLSDEGVSVRSHRSPLANDGPTPKKGDFVRNISITSPMRESFLSRVKREVKLAKPEVNPDPTLESAKELIQRAVEERCENVDLSGQGLSVLPTSIVDLKYIVRDGSKHGFAPLETQLKVFLSNNAFTELPVSVLQLDNLDLLSMRQNQLTEIPPSIRKLKQLTTLNISGNSLPHLPWELLCLVHQAQLHDIQHEPNPWSPEPPLNEQLHPVPLLEINVLDGENSRVIRRVAVQPAKISSTSGGDVFRSNCGSRAPSLTEVVARKLVKENEFMADPGLRDALKNLPHSVLSVLTVAYNCQKQGGRECTFCQRAIVLPRYQWLEWWSITQVNIKTLEELPKYRLRDSVTLEDRQVQVLPFLRMACGCINQVDGLESEATKYEGFKEYLATAN